MYPDQYIDEADSGDEYNGGAVAESDVYTFSSPYTIANKKKNQWIL
jgi:hypothetical protein